MCTYVCVCGLKYLPDHCWLYHLLIPVIASKFHQKKNNNKKQQKRQQVSGQQKM